MTGIEEHDRRLARIHLAEAWRHRHLDRQAPLRDRQARLHVERGAVDVPVELKQDDDAGASERRHDVIELTPAMVASCRSIGAATEPPSISALRTGSSP
jgi:hypothetical protein